MSLFWPPSLKICDSPHRLALGHHPLRLCASRSVQRRFIRSSARTTSSLSKTAMSRCTVRVASCEPDAMYSLRMRLASSIARIPCPDPCCSWYAPHGAWTQREALNVRSYAGIRPAMKRPQPRGVRLGPAFKRTNWVTGACINWPCDLRFLRCEFCQEPPS
jgi:hypothetical protein